ncbi:hypothetical protein EG028_09090 [Chitinophaga barathri]|uniref:Uncharacterized protein n=1 Tax=Chitinophaga barathri TaxID=1647451 RepID=A0A3N4MCA2_9BACT|nr:hypothetical protein EG028_09090 [Chitinophaga barathri]
MFNNFSGLAIWPALFFEAEIISGPPGHTRHYGNNPAEMETFDHAGRLYPGRTYCRKQSNRQIKKLSADVYIEQAVPARWV